MTGDEYIILIALCAVPLLINALLLFDSRTTITSSAIEVKKVRAILFAGVVQCIAYFAEYILSRYNFLGSRPLGMLVEGVLYIANLLYIFSHADLIYSQIRKKLRHIDRLLFLCPTLILFAIELLNLFVPVLFDVRPDTLEYVEMPGVALANMIPVVYVLFSAVNDIRDRGENAHYYDLPLSLYFSFVVFGIALESLFWDVPIIPVSCAVSVVALYIRILKRIGYIDTLSGLFTRAHITEYINSLLKKSPANAMLAGIMLDVDRFKHINDTYGHTVGDDAIRCVGNILKEVSAQNSICFRYGGDEFVILLKVSDQGEITRQIDRIRAAAEKFNARKTRVFRLEFSQGYAIYDTRGDTPLSFVERMDAEMYRSKRERQLMRENH